MDLFDDVMLFRFSFKQKIKPHRSIYHVKFSNTYICYRSKWNSGQNDIPSLNPNYSSIMNN